MHREIDNSLYKQINCCTSLLLGIVKGVLLILINFVPLFIPLLSQKCTERQFPPADVAQILDSAVTSLQPCSSKNLPVYADIEKCMIMIRNQIMALVPT